MASVITIAFEGWKAQEAATGKPVLLNEFVFANVPNLDPNKPIDRNEKLPPANQIVCRQAVNKAGLASENAVAYSVTLGTDVGDFDFNWIGLLNKESNTVAMITHAPTQKKLKTKDGKQGNVLIRSFLLEFNGAAEETQIKTSAETWQIDFTARLSGIDEMQRLSNKDNYGKAAFFGDGFLVTRDEDKYTVKKGLGYIDGLRGELEQDKIFTGLRNIIIYADFSYQGNIVSQWKTVVKLTAAASLGNYIDSSGFQHFVFQIAAIYTSGEVKDLRPTGSLVEQYITNLEAQWKLDLSKKVDKSNITHQKGNSTELITSQQLLTNEVSKLQGKGNYANGAVYTESGDVAAIKTPNGNSTFELGSTGWFAAKNIGADKMTFSVSSDGIVGNCLIPVDCGGTGAKTASSARMALNLYSQDEINAAMSRKISRGENGLFADIGNTEGLTINKSQYDAGFRGSVQMAKSESPYSALIDGTSIITRINDYSAKRGFELAYKVRGKDLCVGFSTSGSGTTEYWEYGKVYTSFNVAEDRNGHLRIAGSNDSSDYPVGAPIPWPQSTAPVGYLVCYGQSFNKSTYPLLAKAYPSGMLPDLRSEFIRGLDAGRNVDSGRTVLSQQGDAIRDITGSLGKSFKSNSPENTGTGAIRSSYLSESGGTPSGQGSHATFDFAASRVVPTASENRPRNIAFLYIVRAA